MIKILTLHHRNPALSREEFIDYWHRVHAPLCSRLMKGLGLRRYVASFPISEGKVMGADAPDCDVVVELHFDDRAALEAALSSDQFNTPERRASSEHVFDLPRMRNIICEESDFPV